MNLNKRLLLNPPETKLFPVKLMRVSPKTAPPTQAPKSTYLGLTHDLTVPLGRRRSTLMFMRVALNVLPPARLDTLSLRPMQELTVPLRRRRSILTLMRARRDTPLPPPLNTVVYLAQRFEARHGPLQRRQSTKRKSQRSIEKQPVVVRARV